MNIRLTPHHHFTSSADQFCTISHLQSSSSVLPVHIHFKSSLFIIIYHQSPTSSPTSHHQFMLPGNSVTLCAVFVSGLTMAHDSRTARTSKEVLEIQKCETTSSNVCTSESAPKMHLTENICSFRKKTCCILVAARIEF